MRDRLRRVLVVGVVAVVVGAIGVGPAGANPLKDVCVPSGDLENSCDFPW